MTTLLICLILTIWIAAIAILSVQNATAVSVQFLFLRSIELPLGVVLAFCVGVGLLTVAVIQLLGQLTPQYSRGAAEDFDEDEDWE